MSEWTSALEAELRYLVRKEYQNQLRRDAACKGKPAFDSSLHARESTPKRAMHGRTQVYRCKFCRKWHVGGHLSTAARERRPRAGVAASYLCGCGHSFPVALGKYGCPNCCGESGAARMAA